MRAARLQKNHSCRAVITHSVASVNSLFTNRRRVLQQVLGICAHCADGNADCSKIPLFQDL